MNKALLEELKPAIEQIIEEKLLSLLGDPDRGLELRPEIRKRLRRSLMEEGGASAARRVARRRPSAAVIVCKSCRKALKKTAVVPAATVARKLGLEW